jgi:hypoxanthine phosphoribosyltransferase
LPSSTSGKSGAATPPKKRPAAEATPSTASPAKPGRRGVLASDRADFAHDSERQYARLLDFYEIEWRYEPRSFDIEWDAGGKVIKQFTPDFYLPAFDLYIEVTTMNQKLVTKKNRKVRRLRELYPGVKIKIFYQRDYLRLLQKYGLADGETASGGDAEGEAAGQP